MQKNTPKIRYYLCILYPCLMERKDTMDKRRQFQMTTRELDWRKVSANKNLREKYISFRNFVNNPISQYSYSFEGNLNVLPEVPPLSQQNVNRIIPTKITTCFFFLLPFLKPIFRPIRLSTDLIFSPNLSAYCNDVARTPNLCRNNTIIWFSLEVVTVAQMV